MANAKRHQEFDSKTALDTAVGRSIERLAKDTIKRVMSPTTAKRNEA